MNQYRSESLGDGYVVHFFHPPGGRILAQVSYESTFVGQCRTATHVGAARWAKRQVRSHQKARRILKGVS